MQKSGQIVQTTHIIGRMEDGKQPSSSCISPSLIQFVYRWGIAMVVAASAFISTCGSSIIAPAIHDMTRDLVGPNGNEQLGIMVTSVYVLGMGCATLLQAQPLGADVPAEQIRTISAESVSGDIWEAGMSNGVILRGTGSM